MESGPAVPPSNYYWASPLGLSGEDSERAGPVPHKLFIQSWTLIAMHCGKGILPMSNHMANFLMANSCWDHSVGMTVPNCGCLTQWLACFSAAVQGAETFTATGDLLCVYWWRHLSNRDLYLISGLDLPILRNNKADLFVARQNNLSCCFHLQRNLTQNSLEGFRAYIPFIISMSLFFFILLSIYHCFSTGICLVPVHMSVARSCGTAPLVFQLDISQILLRFQIFPVTLWPAERRARR